MNTENCPFKFVIGEDTPPNPQSNLWVHFVSAIKRYASFAGRATRKEYWSFVLFITIINAIVSAVLNSMQQGAIESYMAAEILSGNTQIVQDALAENLSVFGLGFTCIFIALVQTLVAIIIGIPLLGVLSRRCHDVGKSSILALILIAANVLYSFTSNFGIMGWLGYIAIIVAGLIGLWLLITVLFCDSDRGTNKYGPSSKYPEA